MSAPSTQGGDEWASSWFGTSDYERACDHATMPGAGQPNLLKTIQKYLHNSFSDSVSKT